MAQIHVADLTFCYEGSFDNIFENAAFSIDTNWRLGLIGRNGKGKTTFARLLLGEYAYQGSITSGGVLFDYFPYEVKEEQMEYTAAELMEGWKENCEDWRVILELNKMSADAEILYRPFRTLSHGERSKIMLAVLFSGENDFLLIDEPTNHLDFETRKTVKAYLQKKKGYILISHDRDLLDACIDHVLVLNRKSIEVQAGNFTSWWENKQKKDAFSESENEKHLKEIASLKRAADREGRWADKSENTKIGFNPAKEPDRAMNARAYIGAKTKKLQSRVKAYEKRIDREIKEKEGLLSDIERITDLKLTPLQHHKEQLVYANDFGFRYKEDGEPLFSHFHMEVRQGERIFLNGNNGCGKSTLIKEILRANGMQAPAASAVSTGELKTASGLQISYVSQDTSFLQGSVKEFCRTHAFNESLFLTVLRHLGFERVQFEKPLESYSEGQKKKVLIAGSLLTSAHLYIWDEPLNYIDVFSRIQIEEMILRYQPTMLIVDHDICFREKIATRVVEIE